MTAIDGWVHDRFGTAWMLHVDALSGVVFTVAAMFVLYLIKRRSPVLAPAVAIGSA